MKLYYGTGSCSLSPHIALREAGMAFDLVKVNLKIKEVEGGGDFNAISPKGYVPILELDDGTRLSEGVAMVQYIADQKPALKLAPANSTMARVQLQEWLNFITSELHKGIGGFFNPLMAGTGAYAEAMKEKALKRIAFVENHLASTKQEYLLADGYSVADGYLFTCLRWAVGMTWDFAPYPHINAYMARVGARPAVKAAMAAEGLV